MIAFYIFVIITYVLIGLVVYMLGSIDEEDLWNDKPFLMILAWPAWLAVYAFEIAVEIIKSIVEIFKNRKK